MLLCEHTSELQPTVNTQEEYDWLAPAQSYPNIEEAAIFFLSNNKLHPLHLLPLLHQKIVKEDSMMYMTLSSSTMKVMIQNHFTSLLMVQLVLVNHTSSTV